VGTGFIVQLEKDAAYILTPPMWCRGLAQSKWNSTPAETGPFRPRSLAWRG